MEVGELTQILEQSTRELIEDCEELCLGNDGDSINESSVSSVGKQPRMRIVCIPARDEADEIVGVMIAQLLRRAGHDAYAIPIGPVSTMLEQVEPQRAELVCVSALPPFAAGQARSLYGGDLR